MARNSERRTLLCDAGIRVLAEQGSRGLTYRAIDECASVPLGTSSNYFATRDALISELVARIGEKLSPKPENTELLTATTGTPQLFTVQLGDIARRLSADPHVSLALIELRLESSRNHTTAATLAAWRQKAFDEDLVRAHDANAKISRSELALFHYALDGLMLDHLTKPLHTGLSFIDTVNELTSRILMKTEQQ